MRARKWQNYVELWRHFCPFCLDYVDAIATLKFSIIIKVQFVQLRTKVPQNKFLLKFSDSPCNTFKKVDSTDSPKVSAPSMHLVTEGTEKPTRIRNRWRSIMFANNTNFAVSHAVAIVHRTKWETHYRSLFIIQLKLYSGIEIVEFAACVVASARKRRASIIVHRWPGIRTSAARSARFGHLGERELKLLPGAPGADGSLPTSEHGYSTERRIYVVL